MGDQPVLRLHHFRPLVSAAIVDVALREAVLPALTDCSGLLTLYCGRQGDDAGTRVIASVWASMTDMTTAVEEPWVSNAFEFHLAEHITPQEVEVLPLAVDLRFDRTDPPQLLRVFRGEARPGELAEYVREARDGAMEDAESGHGAIALFLGIEPPNRFVTVSAWSDWASIEAATGGNIRNPIATRNADRLSSGTGIHYEVLPPIAPETVALTQSTAI